MTAVPAVLPICGLGMIFLSQDDVQPLPRVVLRLMSATKAVSAGTILLYVLSTYPRRMHHGYAVSMHGCI